MHKLTKYVQGNAGALPDSLQRRGFMIAAVSSGFAMTFLRADHSFASGLAAAPSAADSGDIFDPTIWFEIDRDGIVTVNIAKAEMGQHVGTALARIVADELEANWDSVRLNYVDSDPKWGTMVTGGSWSVWQSFDALSRAGAAGRDRTLSVDGVVLSGAVYLRGEDQPVANRDRAAAVHACV